MQIVTGFADRAQGRITGGHAGQCDGFFRFECWGCFSHVSSPAFIKNFP
jgi:hypothetical protein